MALGTGLATQVGAALEVGGYGTWTVPDHFYEVTGANIKQQKNTFQGQGLAGGALLEKEARRGVATRAGAGTIPLDATTSGLGLWLKAHFGAATVALHSGQTTVWDQTHTVAALAGISLSIQEGIPEPATGTVVPFSFPGCKVLDLELALAKNGNVKMTATVDAQKALDSASTPAGAALATASYPASAGLFVFAGASLTLGGSSVGVVEAATFKSTVPMKVDRKDMDGTPWKKEPIQNGFRTVGGSLTAEFAKSALYDAYNADTSLALVMNFLGPNVGVTTVPAQLQITCPTVKLDGETPGVGGPDVVMTTVPWKGLIPSAGGQPVSVLYVSGDSAI